MNRKYLSSEPHPVHIMSSCIHPWHHDRNRLHVIWFIRADEQSCQVLCDRESGVVHYPCSHSTVPVSGCGSASVLRHVSLGYSSCCCTRGKSHHRREDCTGTFNMQPEIEPEQTVLFIYFLFYFFPYEYSHILSPTGYLNKNHDTTVHNKFRGEPPGWLQWGFWHPSTRDSSVPVVGGGTSWRVRESVGYVRAALFAHVTIIPRL